MFRISVLLASVVLASGAGAKDVQEPVVVSCAFEHLPLMQFWFRGEPSVQSDTVQIGPSEILSLAVGSSFMSANSASTSYTFSLRRPASVTVHHTGDSDGRTFYGECISSLQKG